MSTISSKLWQRRGTAADGLDAAGPRPTGRACTPTPAPAVPEALGSSSARAPAPSLIDRSSVRSSTGVPCGVGPEFLLGVTVLCPAHRPAGDEDLQHQAAINPYPKGRRESRSLVTHRAKHAASLARRHPGISNHPATDYAMILHKYIAIQLSIRTRTYIVLDGMLPEK